MIEVAPAPAQGLRFCPMAEEDLDRILSIEVQAYSFPWSPGNFRDSLRSGYLVEMLMCTTGHDEVLGYWVAMPGVEELHLLNLTVAPAHQRQGHARTLLNRLRLKAHELRAKSLWLEVRQSNRRALEVYAAHGFEHVGLRRHYYPAAGSKREDAVVMRLAVESVP